MAEEAEIKLRIEETAKDLFLIKDQNDVVYGTYATRHGAEMDLVEWNRYYEEN
jgi:hypothetical protein